MRDIIHYNLTIKDDTFLAMGSKKFENSVSFFSKYTIECSTLVVRIVIVLRRL